MSVLFYLALGMICGLLLTRLTKLVHLPNVTAYLIAGILIGPFVLGWINHDMLGQFDIITEVALGFIAFSIGDEFKFSALKQIGKAALVITLFESVAAVLLVDAVTLALGFPSPMCLVLGALAGSTAPAATLMVVRQYKASGPLTNMLLPVVAADDATGLIAYSISISIAITLANHQAFSLVNTIGLPIFEILASLVVGGLLGLLLAVSHRFFLSHTNRMSLCIASIFLSAALASYFDWSALLMCMALGATYVNLCDSAERILSYVDDWTYPLFMLFFVISGAELDLYALPKVGVLGLIYVCVRFGGKWLGSFLGATLTKQPKVVKDNIGFALMPQAGVAIGMATLAVRQLPAYGPQIQTVILAATLIYELLGPISAKFALKRAGEI